MRPFPTPPQADALAYLTRVGHRPAFRPDTLADVAKRMALIEARFSTFGGAK